MAECVKWMKERMNAKVLYLIATLELLFKISVLFINCCLTKAAMLAASASKQSSWLYKAVYREENNDFSYRPSVLS